MDAPDIEETAPEPRDPDLSAVVVPLLKGVIYAEAQPACWRSLLSLQARVRDYVRVIGLELTLDESEGYAFLGSLDTTGEEEGDPVPRLIVRRQLSFHQSLLIALLRKKLAEFDAQGEDTRLVLSRDDIVETFRMFMPERTNETRLIDQIDTLIKKTSDLGFLRPLRGQDKMYEVRRILKAYVDAQWLADFDQRLAEYQAHASREKGDDQDA